MEVGCGAANEDAPEPVFEMKSGKCANARDGDIGLAGLAGGSHVDECGVEGKALGFVDRDRVGETEWELDEGGAAGVSWIKLPLEGFDSNQPVGGFDDDRTAREINHGAGLAVDERAVGRVDGEHDICVALEDEDRWGKEILDEELAMGLGAGEVGIEDAGLGFDGFEPVGIPFIDHRVVGEEACEVRIGKSGDARLEESGCGVANAASANFGEGLDESGIVLAVNFGEFDNMESSVLP